MIIGHFSYVKVFGAKSYIVRLRMTFMAVIVWCRYIFVLFISLGCDLFSKKCLRFLEFPKEPLLGYNWETLPLSMAKIAVFRYFSKNIGRWKKWILSPPRWAIAGNMIPLAPLLKVFLHPIGNHAIESTYLRLKTRNQTFLSTGWKIATWSSHISENDFGMKKPKIL